MSTPADRLEVIPTLVEFRFQLRSFLSFSEAAAERHGITAQQYQLLQVVAPGDAASSSITRIAERLLLRHNSAVELIDRAVLAGLVVRQHDPGDQRRTKIGITPHGHDVLHQLVDEHFVYLREAGPVLMNSLQSVLDANRVAR